MTVEQTIGPNLSWLDEELRRQKNVVEELRDLVDKQQVALVDQSQRIIGLEERLTRLQNQLQAIPEIYQVVQNTRDELVALVVDLRQEVQKREAELLRSRQAEREKDTRAIQEIQMQLDRFGVLEQAIAVAEAEDRRLNELLQRMQQEFEALGKAMTQESETRRQLADAISKNTVAIGQIEEQLESLQKAQQGLHQRLLSLDASLAKLAQQTADLQAMRQDITAQQQEMLERQRRADRERTQTMAEWGRRLDSFGHEIEKWAEQLRFFTDQHEKNRQVLREIQTLAQDLNQQQDRLRQLQRLAEEQLRREMREMRVENEQRWAQEAERREQFRLEQARENAQRDERLAALEAGLEDAARMLATLDKRLTNLGEQMEAENQQRYEMLRKGFQAASKEFYTLLNTLRETFGVQE